MVLNLDNFLIYCDKMCRLTCDFLAQINTKLPNNWHESRQKLADLRIEIQAIQLSIFARKTAYETADALRKYTLDHPCINNKVTLYDHEMDFKHARHLALLSYCTVCWTLYDKIGKICFSLSCIPRVAKNLSLKARVCAILLGKHFDKESKEYPIGFGIDKIIWPAYGWPLSASYKIRNYLVHEGDHVGPTPLFRGDKVGDGFFTDDKARKLIEIECKCDKNDGFNCCLPNASTLWDTDDLLTTLKKYHDEIDCLLSCMLGWCLETYCAQIKHFNCRYIPGMSPFS